MCKVLEVYVTKQRVWNSVYPVTATHVLVCDFKKLVRIYVSFFNVCLFFYLYCFCLLVVTVNVVICCMWYLATVFLMYNQRVWAHIIYSTHTDLVFQSLCCMFVYVYVCVCVFLCVNF